MKLPPAQRKAAHKIKRKTVHCRQGGSSLIEGLVAMLLLSFGMLSLGAMLSYAVQMPKLSGYRATAVNLAASHIERIRANPEGFSNGGYDKPSTYDNSNTILATDTSDMCAYPTCDFASLATMDFERTKVAVRAQLPAGGIFMLRDSDSGIISTTSGNLWVVWNEPDTHAALDPSSSDNCPVEVTQAYADPRSRCLYVRIKI
jgi:type IV pilus assembly protein PilV